MPMTTLTGVSNEQAPEKLGTERNLNTFIVNKYIACFLYIFKTVVMGKGAKEEGDVCGSRKLSRLREGRKKF